ncbi:hypothetical protein, partial [Enterococcus faecium]|uniref:hypothetical protein n=1 Tax=Enterococcus faecium TaxID=1352 RepID=UPI0037C0349A
MTSQNQEEQYKALEKYGVDLVKDKELFDFVSEFAQDGFYGDIESFEWANYYAGQTFDYVLFADV